MSNMKDLIGKKVRIQVSEPWDFELPGKGNSLDGTIKGICPAPKEKNWEKEDVLVSLDEPMIWKSKKANQLMVSPYSDSENMSDILRGESVSIGILRVKPRSFLEDGMQFRAKDVEHFAIGSIFLVHK
jgi:hypothetical protein